MKVESWCQWYKCGVRSDGKALKRVLGLSSGWGGGPEVRAERVWLRQPGEKGVELGSGGVLARHHARNEDPEKDKRAIRGV